MNEVKKLKLELEKNNKNTFDFCGFDVEKDKKINFMIDGIEYHKNEMKTLKKRYGDMRKAGSCAKSIYKSHKEQLQLFKTEAEEYLQQF